MRISQNNKILRHLDIYGEISSQVAMKEYGITRLASRIYDLKCMGYKFVSEYRTTKNRFGEPCTYKVYKLVEKEYKK